MVKSLVFLGVVSVSGLLSAASPPENARWVNQYFEQVYAAQSPYFVEGSGWIDSFEQSRKKWAAAADSEQTMRAADVLWADFCQAYPQQSDWLIQDRPEGVPAPDWGEQLLRRGLDCALVKALLGRTLRASVFQRPGVSPPQVADFADLAAGLAEYERIHRLRRKLLLRNRPILISRVC